MDPDLRKLQLKCLEIFDIVDRICRENKILYSLCGGSVVGAHLYKGILPWDDDIDLMMTREHYNKFITVAKESLPNGYSMFNYQNCDDSAEIKICFTKIIDESTTIVLQDGTVLGVNIDIDVYDKVPEGILKHIDIFMCKRLLTIDKGKVASRGIKNTLRHIALSTVLSNKRKYLIVFQRIVEFLGNISSHYTYRELFGAYHYYNMLPYKASIFENYTTIEFEGRTTMVVRDYLDYLETRYNRTDFHEPKEKQIPSHIKYINLNLPYKEYKKQ